MDCISHRGSLRISLTSNTWSQHITVQGAAGGLNARANPASNKRKGTVFTTEGHNGSKAWVHLPLLSRGQSCGTPCREHVEMAWKNRRGAVLSCSHHLYSPCPWLQTTCQHLPFSSPSSVVSHEHKRASLPGWTSPRLRGPSDILLLHRHRTLKGLEFWECHDPVCNDVRPYC